MPSRLHAHVGTLRQLEILLTLQETGGITAAAERLHLTQPTVSMQLRKLADAVGLPLWEQSGRQIRLTEAGRLTARMAREVLDDFARLDMELADLRGVRAGTLRLAVVTTAKYFIPHLLGPFARRYPDVDITLDIGNRAQIIERLAEGMNDFYVFSHPPDSMSLNMTGFLPNPLVAIAPRDHPLADRRAIDVSELAGQPFLARERGSGTRHALEAWLDRYGVALNVRMTIESNEAIKHAVMSGLGISVLSAHTLAFGGDAGLAVLDVKQLPIRTQWSFAWPERARLSVVARTFLDYVAEEGLESLHGQQAGL